MSKYTEADICALDFTAIKRKLMHRESGASWSPARADAVEREYRRFLSLMRQFPGEQTSPTVDVDTFWHYHILDTIKYAKDCEAIFGYFLHHYPYVGMGGDDGARTRGGERLRELYAQAYGAFDAQEDKNNTQAGAAYCGAALATAYCGAAEREPGSRVKPPTARPPVSACPSAPSVRGC